jgi:hypothetical protein
MTAPATIARDTPNFVKRFAIAIHPLKKLIKNTPEIIKIVAPVLV